MRAVKSSRGLNVRITAGTTGVLIAMNLDDPKGCLGFSIQRTDMGGADASQTRWLPSMLHFPKDTKPDGTCEKAPIQKFLWGDYAVYPATAYRYKIVARGGTWDNLTELTSVELDVQTEDPSKQDRAVYFNRGAAASNAYTQKFGNVDPDKLPEPKRTEAYTWLSRGLEEALLAFLAQATGPEFGLRAAIYEFQKQDLLLGLRDASNRGADVQVVYHHRQKPTKPGESPDDTWSKNDDAIKTANIGAFCKKRAADPQGAIMHDKFVVLLRNGQPQAVWTGSTNWTDGGLYGQLNVGHAVYDPGVAGAYLKLWQGQQGHPPVQGLSQDPDHADSVKNASSLTPVPKAVGDIAQGITPVFSPQADLSMIELYAEICSGAKTLFVCAPFELHPDIRKELEANDGKALHYVLADKTGSLGKNQEVDVFRGSLGDVLSAATTLSSGLHDFQDRLLEGKEGFHHAGIHIHSKFILSNPFGDDPILVTGSANFSNNSTKINDSNSLIIRGSKEVADIYLTEFMRMFEHYLFRGKQADAKKKGQPDHSINLSETDAWTAPYYDPKDVKCLERKAFAGG